MDRKRSDVCKCANIADISEILCDMRDTAFFRPLPNHRRYIVAFYARIFLHTKGHNSRSLSVPGEAFRFLRFGGFYGLVFRRFWTLGNIRDRILTRENSTGHRSYADILYIYCPLLSVGGLGKLWPFRRPLS